MMELAEIDADLGGLRMALLLMPFLLAAILTDVSSRSVPNVLIVMMLVSGVLAQITGTASASEVLLASLGGACVGLMMLLPFYVFGGMGAGDVKLLAGAGSFLGPQGALLAGFFTLGAGAALGLAVIMGRRIAPYVLARRSPAVAEEPSTAVQLPYSLAISAGTLIAVLQW